MSSTHSLPRTGPAVTKPGMGAVSEARAGVGLGSNEVMGEKDYSTNAVFLTKKVSPGCYSVSLSPWKEGYC